MVSKKADILSALQTDILRLQGYKTSSSPTIDLNLGPIKAAFPNGAFPVGAVHEFLPAGAEDAAAASGFMTGLLSTIMGSNGTSLWISSSRTLFPPALKSFGIQPDRFIFVDLQKEKEVRWAFEEALKCPSLSTVVGELPAMDFTFSRRMQLAVEQSKVTGFVLRPFGSQLTPSACVSRWRIASLPGETNDGLPGVGFPQWSVELLRVKNGKPGSWEVRWENGRFCPVHKTAVAFEQQQLKAG